MRMLEGVAPGWGITVVRVVTFALPAPGGATGWPSIQLRGQ
jgi:hypothetical protein